MCGAAVGLTPSVDQAELRVAAVLAARHVADVNDPVPARFAAALIATEDARFYTHRGIDGIGVLRNLASVMTGASQDAGGSTLDQQLAKQLNLVDPRTALATPEQVVLAVKLDSVYSKAQILEMYSSVVYFGQGFYGLDSASRGYFGVPPLRLSWGQAALLAGLVQAPSADNPLIHPDAARQRQRDVLDRLVATGVLSATQAAAAAAAPLDLTS